MYADIFDKPAADYYRDLAGRIRRSIARIRVMDQEDVDQLLALAKNPSAPWAGVVGMTTAEFLVELSQRVRMVPPMYDLDQGDVDQLRGLALLVTK